jgi:hypothetical protein
LLFHFARYRHARTERLAFVDQVLAGHSNRDRLQTLKSSRRFEMRALLAAMQRGIALGAVGFEVYTLWKGRRAAIASRRGDSLHQAGEAGPGNVD